MGISVVFLILLLLALVCFFAAATAKVASRFDLVALGLALWVLVPLIQTIRAL